MFKTIIQRFKTESPDFFKKITNICVKCGAISGLILAAPGLPAIATTIAGYLATASVVGGVISKLTCQDPSQKDETLK
jgi:hypothetical protein